jgi:competence protein ComEA
MPISKRNRRAVLALLMLTTLISFVPRLSSPFGFQQDSLGLGHADLKIAASEIQERQEVWNKSHSYRSKKKGYGKKFKRPKSKFDPNTYQQQDWTALGLSPKQADIIVKLSKRGFRSNEDLERIYVLPKEAYKLLKDSTFYAVQEKSSYQGNQYTPTVRKTVLVDLNTGNQEEFEQIPGIGEYFARKIVDYRQQLGGFINAEQLMEVWKIDAVKYTEIEPFVKIVNKSIQKISINTATTEELQKHPYITYKVANSIVKMRGQHGDYKDVSEIKRSVLIDEVTYQKIKPYLTI